ncbi:MAG TPA: hypothetical protein PLW93_06460, partial [Candidatus Absconditabacterales bacterium]|nr:hypothetical protein [Candidatus Absconditabacterales bacterium]
MDVSEDKISYALDVLPEFSNLQEEILTLADNVGLTDMQCTSLKNAITSNAYCYTNSTTDVRSIDITLSGNVAPKPLHHMLMVYIFLYVYAKNIGSIKRMFPTLDAVYQNCFVLLFHDSIEDQKQVGEIVQGVMEQLMIEDKKRLNSILDGSRTDTMQYDISHWLTYATGEGAQQEKNALLALFSYIETVYNTTSAALIARNVWLMSRLSITHDEKFNIKENLQRLCGSQQLVFNKILDCLMNALTNVSLRKALDKKRLAAQLITDGGRTDMDRLIPYIPQLLDLCAQFIVIPKYERAYVHT